MTDEEKYIHYADCHGNVTLWKNKNNIYFLEFSGGKTLWELYIVGDKASYVAGNNEYKLWKKYFGHRA